VEPIVRLAKTRFTEMFFQTNHLDLADFHRWAFLPGMRFGSMAKWWGDFGPRDFPHEGVDLCLYEDRRGEVRRLDETTRIPVMGDGVVRAIFKDYLGQAVIIEHEDTQGGGGKCLSVYAHTRPRNGLRPGQAVRQGDVIATIADTRRSKARIFPHLHLSLSKPASDLIYENFVWNIMRDPGRITLVDPMGVIVGRWRELEHGYKGYIGR
jgi:murein DD-endopeptidase MepM/ murein hydrolase activator NlpD